MQPAQQGDYAVTAINAFGNSYSAQAHLTVMSPPTARTLPASGTNNFAIFSGTVNPNGLPTTAWFEWGPSTSYGHATPESSIGAGMADTPISVGLDQLTPGVAYHYRLVATNAAGRSNGYDAIFQAPRIILVGGNLLTNECHHPFDDPGAFASSAPWAIAAGLDFSVVLRADGTVVGWGYNGHGQLNVPLGLTNVMAIAVAGNESVLALGSDGTVVGWGANEAAIPVGLSNVIAVAGGQFHSLALKADGTVVAWGGNWTGGNPESDIPLGLNNVTAVAAGNFYSIALKTDGTLVGWGYDINGVLGIPEGLTNVTRIAAGWDFALALKSDGTVAAWGGNFFGQTDTPPGLSNLTAIATGYGFSLALKADGTVVKWGWDDYFPDVSVPSGLSHVVDIAAGNSHALALKDNGTIVSWGGDSYGETVIPAGLTNLPVAIGVAGNVDPNTPGTYSLTYAATNRLGIVGSISRTVVVVNTTPPQIICPTNIVADFLTETGSPVAFAPTAIDACSTSVARTCTPQSGSTFPIGTTPVRCVAADPSGNTNSCTFLVVLGARGTKSNVLSQLSPCDERSADRKTSKILETPSPTFASRSTHNSGFNETHLERRCGPRVFNEQRLAVRALVRYLDDKRSTIPDPLPQTFIQRIVEARSTSRCGCHS